MPSRLFVTIGSRRRKDRILLELPMDQPIGSLMPDLIQVLGWKELSDAPKHSFYLETDEGERLPDDKSFQDAGVVSSDLLFIGYGEAQPAVPKGKEEQAPNSAAPAAESARAQEILAQPHFTGPRGLVFLLSQSPATIGRSGKGGAPDIDLAEWDPKMIVSRRHAVVEKTRDGFALRPEKTTNGTFINGVEVPAGETRHLGQGDRINFGFKGLELTFETGETSEK